MHIQCTSKEINILFHIPCLLQTPMIELGSIYSFTLLFAIETTTWAIYIAYSYKIRKMINIINNLFVQERELYCYFECANFDI